MIEEIQQVKGCGPSWQNARNSQGSGALLTQSTGRGARCPHACNSSEAEPPRGESLPGQDKGQKQQAVESYGRMHVFHEGNGALATRKRVPATEYDTSGQQEDRMLANCREVQDSRGGPAARRSKEAEQEDKMLKKQQGVEHD